MIYESALSHLTTRIKLYALEIYVVELLIKVHRDCNDVL